jgi:hypothetical protein
MEVIKDKSKYTLVNSLTKNSMRLQGIGIVKAQPASQIKEGDKLMWNFGAIENVIKVTKQTDKSIWIDITSKGKHYNRMLSKTRLICILH